MAMCSGKVHSGQERDAAYDQGCTWMSQLLWHAQML